MPTRKLIATLNAVDQYEWPVGPLAGCVNDALEWQRFLESLSSDFDLALSLQLNEQATRTKILSGLQSALEEAEPEDAVFFFYSGHGAREHSHDVFKQIDSDGLFEALVPYDGVTYEKDKFVYRLIADKELHFILSKFTKPRTHVLMVFDCCHSGNVTRNAFSSGGGILKRRFMPPSDAAERLGIDAPRRDWSDFNFAQDCEPNDLADTHWFQRYPQKAHVTLSACLNDESAFEINGEGVFTKNALKILKSTKGKIPYRTFRARLKGFVRNQMNQTPEVYVPGEFDHLMYSNFLDLIGEAQNFTTVTRWHKEHGWIIDMGRTLGVKSTSGPVLIHADGVIEARINRLFNDYTSVAGDELETLDKSNSYGTVLTNYLLGSGLFYIEESEPHKTEFKSYVERSSATAGYELVDSKIYAQYLVQLDEEKVRITRNDSLRTPVWERHRSQDALSRLDDAMRHISKYHFIKDYENPDTEFHEIPEVRIHAEVAYPDGRVVVPDLERRSIELDFENNLALRLRIENKSHEKYFVSLLYLNNTYGITANLIDGKVKHIQPASGEWILSGRKIPVVLEPHITEMQLPHSLSYLKMIVNKEEFSADQLELNDLPPVSRSDALSRGLAVSPDRDTLDWFTQTIEIKVKNPAYNGIV